MLHPAVALETVVSLAPLPFPPPHTHTPFHRVSPSRTQLAVVRFMNMATIQLTSNVAAFTPCAGAPLAPAGQLSSLLPGSICPPRRGQPHQTASLLPVVGAGGVGIVFSCT